MRLIKLELSGLKAADQTITFGVTTILDGPNGCLAADSIIDLNRAGNGHGLPISDLVARFNGTDGGWDSSIPTLLRSMHKDNSLRLNPLERAYFSGVKPTFRLRTASREIRATADHVFITPGGDTRLGDLRVGSLVFVVGGRGFWKTKAGERKKPTYLFTYRIPSHPFARHRPAADASCQWAVPTHRIIAEARINELAPENYVNRLRGGEIDGLQFLDPCQLHVHHVDRNTHNNSPENLEVIPAREHLRQHGKEGHWHNVVESAVVEPVEAIEAYGEEPTFDLSMADAPNNFVANGFVVHNSGKSAAIQALHLLATGAAPDPTRPDLKGTDTDVILRNARDGFIRVVGTFDHEGQPIIISRTWDRNAKEKQKIEISGAVSVRGSMTEKRAWIAMNVGGFSEAWKPEELTSLSPAKLRTRLLALAGGATDMVVPKNCPEWAKPLAGQSAAEWIRCVLLSAKERLSRARAEHEAVCSMRLSEQDAPPVPSDVEPIEEQLQSLRGQLRSLGARDEAANALLKAEAALDHAQAAAPAKTDVTPEEARTAPRISAEIHRARRELSELEAEVAALPDDLTADEAALGEALATSTASLSALTSCRAKITEAEARLKVLRQQHAGHETCPNCGYDLAAARAEEVMLGEAELVRLRKPLTDLELAASQAQLNAQYLERALHRAELEPKLAQARMLLEALEAKYHRLSEGTWILDRHRHLADLAHDVEIAKARVEGLQRPEQSAEELEAEIKAVQQKLSAAVAGNALFDNQAQLGTRLRTASDEMEHNKEWIKRFGQIETELLAAVRGSLLTRITEATGKRAEIQLVDSDEKETCRLLVETEVDGRMMMVDAATISDGQRIAFLAGLVVALARTSESRWRPVIVDRIESVSANQRAAFIRALDAPARAGLVDNVILAGCPDTELEIEGVSVVHCPAVAEAQGVAA